MIIEECIKAICTQIFFLFLKRLFLMQDLGQYFYIDLEIGFGNEGIFFLQECAND
jgi:hypothetical protein